MMETPPSTTEPLRIGIVGSGGMAAQMADAIAGLPACRAVSVLSHSAPRAEGFARRFGLAGAYHELSAFLAGPSLEAVYIGAANRDHMAIAQACIAARIPVLVEKPLTTTQADTTALIAAARAQNCLLMENLWPLTLPGYSALKARIATGDLGAPRHLGFDFSLPVSAQTLPNLFDPDHGGVLLDRGGYGVAMAIDLLGPVILGPVEECACIVRRDAAGVDIGAALQLRHAGHDGQGASSQITVSVEALGSFALDLSLSRGHLRLGPPSLGAEWLSEWQGDANDSGPRADPLGGSALSRVKSTLKAQLKSRTLLRRLRGHKTGGSPEFHSFGVAPYAPVMAHFAGLVRAGKTDSPVVPLSLSQQVSGLLDKARAPSTGR
jgi:predicted dehydrogenase